MTDRTDELRSAHDVLADFYAERLAGQLEDMPVERAMLRLYTELIHGADIGRRILDVGAGTGRLEPFLAAQRLSPHGIDLSGEMVKVARRDNPDFEFDLADVRALPFADQSYAGVLAWYSLMYLAPEERTSTYAELARVIAPGGYLLTAFKVGDGTLRRGGESLGLGIGFDIYWQEPTHLENLLSDSGFRSVLSAQRPAEPDEQQPQGYILARRTSTQLE